ncbi:serine protease [Actinomadura kijaniata]|uniref:V8-like Glu-specific endopeptidase n=1 Tax=Actinomadura namibiensis TaxID=182080 RepID=A0A7W3LR59_ACTNM|nr:serine protease [Actinomadura namibiensis]MBA8952712.1 V8-like Glu-specific endopeptidase [Actinomadura namibiensis]
MTRRLLGAALAAVTAGGLLAAAPAHASATKGEVDFTGIVALSNCSGSIVRGPLSRDTDAALVMTNGHCLETGMPKAGEVIVDRPSGRTFDLLDRAGKNVLGKLRATRIEYATMTDTDVTVYRLNTTYRAIRQRYGVSALKLSLARPHAGTRIAIPSGYWRRTWTCKIDGFAYRMKEAGWTWKDSIRYTPECDIIGGTSGSPIVDTRSKRVIGVNNTGNTDGERCTLNNPCEVDRNGRVTVRRGIGYGQQTYLLARCLTRGNDVRLDRGCKLPRPARR